MAWTEWQRFAGMKANPADHCKRGVYQVRATTEDGKAIAIPRACGVDSEGILYIGEGNLSGRVGLLMRIHEPEAKFHHSFIRIFKDYGLDRIAKREHLEIRWMECDDCEATEGRLLEEYKRATGDIPPGNRKLGQNAIDQ